MASINNWLAFSLSPQELPSQPPTTVDHHHHQDHHHHHHHSQAAAVSRYDISNPDVSGECFDLASDSSAAPSLNLPPPFGILEAFNRNHQSQDWNMKGLAMNGEGNYKASSELSMLMGSASCNSQHHLDQTNHEQPKLENFLGNHSFSNHHQRSELNTMYTAAAATGEYMYPNCSLQLEDTANARASNGGDDSHNNNDNNNNNSNNNNISTGNGGSSIGLSMIKTWLRNQPAPTSTTTAQPAEQAKSNGGGGGGSQSLSLSMSTGSQTGSPLPLLTTSNGGGGSGGESSSSDNNKQQKATPSAGLDSQNGAMEAMPRKSIDTFGQRTSIYRGVTRHRWTGRYEAHLWDNSCRREGQTRKGRQVYLGGYDKEEKAARAYDLAALKYWGTTTTTNFPISNYEKELEEMKHMTRQEYVASLRRKSSGFSRGASIYRGVTRHHQHGRWQARIGRVAGNKDLYLGTFSTQEEAAEAYDIAAIKFRGLNAVTNFDMSRYDVKSILESSTLPIGGAAKRLKDVEQAEIMAIEGARADNDDNNMTSHLTDGIHSSYGAAAAAAAAHHGWPTIAFQQAAAAANQPFSMHYPYGQRVWCKQEQDTNNTTSHAYHDLHQLQLGSTHNFFQPSVLHNLMAIDSSSMDHSSASSNSAIYSANGGESYGGNGGYVFPLSTVVANDNNQNHQANGFGSDSEAKALGLENMYGNMYYVSQQSSTTTGGVKAGSYDHHQASACNNWVPTAVPTIAQRSGNMAVCHGAPTFTVWNDT